jgi:hypothetical protein
MVRYRRYLSPTQPLPPSPRGKRRTRTGVDRHSGRTMALGRRFCPSGSVRGVTLIKSVAGLSWRGSRRTDRGRGARQGKMLQDALYGLGLHDGSDHAHAGVAPGAVQGVDQEHPEQQISPWDPCPSGDDDVRSAWGLVAPVRCSCFRPHRAGDHEFTPAGCRRQDTRIAGEVGARTRNQGNQFFYELLWREDHELKKADSARGLGGIGRGGHDPVHLVAASTASTMR